MPREFPSRRPATSGSWPTSTRARPRRPSGSSTTRAAPTRSARSTRAPPSWTGWSRSRSAASRSRRAATTCSVARLPDQHHRHARPRRLHRRGRAVAARPRRRGRGLRRRRRRRAPDRDRVAPGQQVQRPADLLRQQDGPHRRRLLPLRRHDPRPPRRGARRRAAPDRRRERLPRRHRPPRDEGDRLAARRRHRGAKFEVVDIPAELADEAEHWRHELARGRRHVDDTLLEKYLDDEEITADEIRTAVRTRHHRGEFVPVLCGSAFKNKGVQPLLDAVVDYLPSPLDVPPIRGHRPEDGEDGSSARPTTTSRSPRSRSRS